MILLDGKKIAGQVKEQLRKEAEALKKKLCLAIVYVGENEVTELFISLKRKFAADIGVAIKLYRYDGAISAKELRMKMGNIAHNKKVNGIIVQLPLPAHLDAQSILNAVIPQKDVDVMSARGVGDFMVGKSRILPPVVSAVKALFDNYGIDVKGRKAVILGHGKLVGQPINIWLARSGAAVSIVPAQDVLDTALLKSADIIISGIGRPHAINGNMVKEGVVVVDVGTSESKGQVLGDVDFASVSKKAAYITPVKGGVGPLTVAMVFRNLITLAKLRKR